MQSLGQQMLNATVGINGLMRIGLGSRLSTHIEKKLSTAGIATAKIQSILNDKKIYLFSFFGYIATIVHGTWKEKIVPADPNFFERKLFLVFVLDNTQTIYWN